MMERRTMAALVAACVAGAACAAPKTSSDAPKAAAPAPPASPPVTGTYSWAPNPADSIAGCRLQAEQRGADSVRYDLDCNRGAPSYNMGSARGTILLQARTAEIRFTEFGGDCTISLAFADSTVAVTQSGADFACGFGFGVSASAGGPTVYRKLSADVPVFVEPTR